MKHLDLDAVNRIIARVDVPADIDRQELLADLEGIRNLYRTGADLRYRPKERQQKLDQIIAGAERLKSLLSLTSLSPGEWHLYPHRSALNRLITDAQKGFPEPLTTMLGVGAKVSAFENLIGLLCSTFMRHFDEMAGYTVTVDTTKTRGGDVHGRFIDFAEAALTVLEIDNAGAPYTRKAIANALSKIKPQKPNR